MIITFLCKLTSMLCLVTGFTSIDTIAFRMDQQKWLYPQERISILTDAEEYAAGDTIWMDVRLVDSSSLQSSKLSRFVYIELTDPLGSTYKRVKLKNSEEGMHGYIPLPNEMAEGIYTLTGYTLFMGSNGPDYFFTKPVYVYGSGRPGNLPTFSFTRKSDSLLISADLGNNSNPAIIEITTPDGKTYSSFRKKSNHSFELKSNEWKKGVALAKIGNYSLFVPLPPDSTDLRVSMTPEGGNLVPDIINNVGLMISDAVGRGIKMNGKIVDSRGDSITAIETDRYGFGSFRLRPDAGENYQAVVAGQFHPLPHVNKNAATLQVNPQRKDVEIIVPVGKVPDDAILLIHCRGSLIYYGAIKKDIPYTFKKSDLQPGINEICLLDRNLNIISRRPIFIDAQTDISLLLDADIPAFRTQAYEFNATADNIPGRKVIDNVMLCLRQWRRYDIQSVIKGYYEHPTAELEIGSEISGIVKSRWKGKPVADAEVSIISSDIDYWNSTKTDREGRFILNGVDWPDGTRFVVKVNNAKGDYEDNYTIEENTYPNVNHIVPTFEGDVYVVKKLDNADIRDRLSKWLDEVEVTAMSKKDNYDDITQIYEIIGGKTIDQNYFDSRAITTYEAAIRSFPGLVIQNGKVMNHGKDVEFWVDGVKWVAPYENMKSPHELGLEAARKQAELNTANIMTGGLLPPDLALKQYSLTKSPLSDLASSFPFNIVEKIIYMRPATALIVSNHAAFAGGALMIYTKNKNTGKHIDYDLHLKIISPLGYQK